MSTNRHAASKLPSNTRSWKRSSIQRANEARAEQHRLELERMREAREDEEARHRARIEAFYQMQHNYGDMVRVRLQGDTMRINGHSRAYRPVRNNFV